MAEAADPAGEPPTLQELEARLARLEDLQQEMLRLWSSNGELGQELAALRQALALAGGQDSAPAAAAAGAMSAVDAGVVATLEPKAPPNAPKAKEPPPMLKPVTPPPSAPVKAEVAADSAPGGLDAEAGSGDELPYTRGIRTLLEQVDRMREAMQELADAAYLMGTSRPMDVDFQRECCRHWNEVSAEFERIHSTAMAAAEAKFREHKRNNLPVRNPMAFWNGEALRQYSEFRTRTVIEKFFDPVELRVNQLRDEGYREMLDGLASIFDLEQMTIQTAQTRFDSELHECVDIGPDKGAEGKVRVVSRVLLSGYIDQADGLVIRKAFVKTQLAEREAKDLRRSLAPSKPKTGALEDTNAKGSTVSDLGEVMVPRQVVSVKNRVTRMNVALKRILGTDLPEELGTSVNYEVRAAAMDLVARFYKQFTQFHERSKALAFLNYKRMKAESNDEDLSPASGWDKQMVFEYVEYRSRRLMEDCLDRIEEKVVQLGALDHLLLLDLLAQEMEVGRMAVTLGSTPYDPDRHTIDSRMVTGGVNLKGRPVVRLLQSGYMDLSSGQVLRKATVRVQL